MKELNRTCRRSLAACALTLALCCPALAGDIHTTQSLNGQIDIGVASQPAAGGDSAQGDISTTVAGNMGTGAAGNMQNGAAGDISTGVSGDITTGASLTGVVLALLRGVFTLP